MLDCVWVRKMRIVDLSMPLSDGTPVYPSDPEVEIKTIRRIETDGYYMNYLMMGEHVGTHVDAPAHFIANGKTVEKIPLDVFFGEGVVLRPQEVSGDLRGKVLLLLTEGRSIDVKTAGKVVKSGVKLVGIDSMSIGNEEVHRLLLGEGIPIIENLTNLKLLKGKRFLFFAFPLPIVGGSGSPVRAVAIIPERETQGGLYPCETSLWI